MGPELELTLHFRGTVGIRRDLNSAYVDSSDNETSRIIPPSRVVTNHMNAFRRRLLVDFDRAK